MMCNFEDMKGETLVSIDGAFVGSESIKFTCASGRVFELRYEHDCCEHVALEDVAGDVADLIGSPLLMCELVTSKENPPGTEAPDYQDSFTWSFYKLATSKGYVTLRWYGENNGYYCEVAYFEELKGGPS